MKRLLLVLALCAGCRSLPFPDPHYEGVYGAAVKKWTRTTTLYSGLETRAFARAVYMSDEFVAAQAAEISRLRAELPDRAAETLAKLREDTKTPTVFFVLYLPDKTANDLNETDSVWRIALNVGLGEQKPEKIERFDRPFNAEQRALYPYLDEYSTAYRFRFPVPQAPGAEKFSATDANLVVAGALGKLNFHWSLDGREDVGPQATGTSSSEQGAPVSPKP